MTGGYDILCFPGDINLRVIQARGSGDERWFNVMFGTYTGWVVVRAGGNWLVMGSAQHENIVVVESDRVADIRKTPSGERHATLPPFGGGVGLENGTRVIVAPYPNTVNGWVRIESWRAGLASRVTSPNREQNERTFEIPETMQFVINGVSDSINLRENWFSFESTTRQAIHNGYSRRQ